MTVVDRVVVMRWSTSSSFALAAACATFGCSSSSNPQCRVGADCASGACDPDGRCVIVAAQDTGSDTAVAGDGGSEAKLDTSPASDAPLGCAPNGDDLVTGLELPFAAGLKATFRVATNVTVSTAGTTAADGRRQWDFSAALSGDHDVLVETTPPAGQWWSSSFPSATYGTSLSSTSDLLGVFEVSPDALYLLGEVSSADGASKTQLTNATPVPTLKYPLDPSSAWSVTTAVNGLTSGVPSAYQDAYDSKVDAAGEAITPFGSFHVLRVRTVLTRTVGVVPTVVRTFAFVTDCFGPVVTITSNPNESQEEFTSAAELRRLAP